MDTTGGYALIRTYTVSNSDTQTVPKIIHASTNAANTRRIPATPSGDISFPRAVQGDKSIPRGIERRRFDVKWGRHYSHHIPDQTEGSLIQC